MLWLWWLWCALNNVVEWNKHDNFFIDINAAVFLGVLYFTHYETKHKPDCSFLREVFHLPEAGLRLKVDLSRIETWDRPHYMKQSGLISTEKWISDW